MKKREKPNYKKTLFVFKLAVLLLASCFSSFAPAGPAKAETFNFTRPARSGYQANNQACDLRGPSTSKVITASQQGAELYWDETLKIYVEFQLNDPHDREVCRVSSQNDPDISFSLGIDLAGQNGSKANYYNGRAKAVAMTDSSGNFVGFKGRFGDTDLRNMFQSSFVNTAVGRNQPVTMTATLRIYRPTADDPNHNDFGGFQRRVVGEQGANAPHGQDDVPPTPEGSGGFGANQGFQIGDVAVTIGGSSDGSQGFRNKYRIKKDDAFLNLGSFGADPIWAHWTNPDPGKHPQPDQIILSGQTSSNARFKDIYLGLSYKYDDTSNFKCDPGVICSNLLFTTSQDGYEREASNQLPHQYTKLRLANARWAKYVESGASGYNANPGPGKPLNSAGFSIFPVVFTTESSILLNKQPANFVLEIFATDQDIIQACKDEGRGEEFCNDLNNAKYKVGELTGVNTTGANNNGTGGTTPGRWSWLWGLLGNILQGLLIILNGIIYVVFAFIVLPLIQGVLGIRVYTDAFVNVILPGWLILRNLSNIVLILGMLMIGLGTLFRIEKYNYKHLLVQLIIAAVAVNFSLVVGQAVLGVADTVQTQFLPPEQCGVTEAPGEGTLCNYTVVGALAQKLMIDPALQNFTINSSGDATIGQLVGPFITVWLALMAFFVFVAMAMFLVIRLVFLWILLMVSPIAYAARVIPSTQQYFTRWWKEFIKYAFTVPIFAFFLNMAALLAVETQKSSFQSMFHLATNDQTITTTVFGVTSNLLIMAFLIFGLMFAQSTGTYAAQGITSFARKASSVPFYPLQRAIPWGAEVFHAKTGIEIRPTKWIEGFKKSREITQRQRQAAGIAKTASRGSTLGNPSAWWQRNWSLRAVGRQMKGGDRTGRVYLGAAENKKRQAEYAEEMAKREGLPEEQKQAYLNRANQLYQDAYRLEEKGRSIVSPTDFETQHELRKAIGEEKNDIHAESWEELVDLIHSASEEGNFPRFQAIMQKLAETYNENEAASHMRYLEDKIDVDGTVHKKGDFFDQSSRGLADFYRQYVGSKKGFNLGDQTALRALTDVSDIAEQQRHYGVMRIVDNKHGDFRIKEEDEVDNERGVEKGKLAQQRLAADANRLGDHYEYTSLDGRTRFDLAQNNAVKRIVNGGAQQRFFIGRGIMNRSNTKAHAARYNVMKLLQEVNAMGTEPGSVGAEEIEIRDRNGNLVRDGGGNIVKMTRRQDALGTVLSVIDSGDKEWTREERVSHEEALEERVKRGSLDKFEVDRLKKSGYLDANGNIKDRDNMGSVADLKENIISEIEPLLRDL